MRTTKPITASLPHDLLQETQRVARLEGIVPHDPDHRILEGALATHAEILVTGITKHFRQDSNS